MFKIIIKYFKYLNFNKNNLKPFKNTKSLILVEFTDIKTFAFSNSYFSHTLSNIHNSNINFYYPNFLTFTKRLKFIINKLNPLSNYYLYKSFSNKIIIPQKLNNTNYSRIEKIFKKIKKNDDIVNLKYNGIQIGDAIYDEFLARYNFATIEIKSKLFKSFFFETYELIFFWENYILNQNVKSIIISHSVYVMGLIGRIGLSNDIDVYVIGPISHYKLSKEKFIKWNDHYEYPKEFKKFLMKDKKKLINEAKKNINLRFTGKQDFRYKVARPISPVFSGSDIVLRKNKSKKKNILIAAHCFMDAPHVYGKMIFYDFYEWLDFLGKKSQEKKFKKNFNWLIKVHPSLYAENIKIFQNLIKKFPSFKLVKKNETHNNLLKNIGIDIVLTVYGSIAHEYSLFNIPVINAGTNPHMGYKFSITAKSKTEYDKILNNLLKKKQNFKTNKNEIYEFYAMHHLLDYDFFKDFKIKVDLKSNSIKSFVKFYDVLNNANHKKKIDIYREFIYSRKRRLINISK